MKWKKLNTDRFEIYIESKNKYISAMVSKGAPNWKISINVCGLYFSGFSKSERAAKQRVKRILMNARGILNENLNSTV